MKPNNIWCIWDEYCVRLHDEIHRHPPEFAKSETIICTLIINPCLCKRREHQRVKKKERRAHWETELVLSQSMKAAVECSVTAFHKICQGKKRMKQPKTLIPKYLPVSEPKYRVIKLICKESAAAHYYGQGAWQGRPETLSQIFSPVIWRVKLRELINNPASASLITK